MATLSKNEAQQRADQIKAFQQELQKLESDAVLNLAAEQHDAIQHYHDSLLNTYSETHDIDRDHRGKQLSLGMRIASFLGALALAASVFFLFYQFWGRLTTSVQLLILISAPVLTFIATMVIARREHTGYFTKLAALVSFACFVLNITMFGQIFNITPTDKALIVWAAFAFLLAYSCDIRLLLAAAIICVIAYMSARTGTWHGGYWIHFGERPENFFPAAIVLFFFPWFVKHKRFWGFAPIYRVFGLLTAFIPILILSNWAAVSYLEFDYDIIEGGYQILGFTLAGLAVWLGIRQRWNDVVNTGNVFFVIFLYTKMFDWWWEIMPKYLFFLLVALTAILFLFIFKRLRGKGYLKVAEADV